MDIHVHIDIGPCLKELLNDWKSQLNRIEGKLDKMSAETTALLKKIDDATNAVAARIQKLIDASNDPTLNAALQAEVDRLTAMGADPNNPVPA